MKEAHARASETTQWAVLIRRLRPPLLELPSISYQAPAKTIPCHLEPIAAAGHLRSKSGTCLLGRETAQRIFPIGPTRLRSMPPNVHLEKIGPLSHLIGYV